MRLTILKMMLATTLAVFAAPASAGSHSVLPPDAKPICQLTQKDFNDNWLNLTFPKTKGNPLGSNTIPGVYPTIGPFYDNESGIVYIFPADGPNFDPKQYGESNKNCAFFDWANHMFYWLTSTVNDGRIDQPPQTRKTPNAMMDYVFESEWFYQAVAAEDGKLALVRADAVEASKGATAATPRATKLNEDGVGQAGGDGVLFTQPMTAGAESGSLVYYSIHTNRAYGYMREAVRRGSWFFDFKDFTHTREQACSALYYGLLHGYVDISGEYGPLTLIMIDDYCPLDVFQELAAGLEWFIEKEIELLEAAFPEVRKIIEHLEKTNPYSVKNLGEIKNLIPFVEPAVDFLSMSTEVKISWVLAETLKNADDYVQVTGVVPVFSAPEETGVMRQTGVQTARLAMVGMHIVGSIKDHPEMIWATVEHQNNTPSVSYYYEDKNNEVKLWTDRDHAPADGWLFSNGNDANANVEYASLGDGGEIEPVTDAPVNTATNALRLSPWGGAPNKAAAMRNTELISMNQTVRNVFRDYYDKIYKGENIVDPRLNYIVTGVSWGKKGQHPTGANPGEIGGTPRMANTTMETFTQKIGDTVNKTGCFGCHGVEQGKSGFTGSHIFNSIVSVEK